MKTTRTKNTTLLLVLLGAALARGVGAAEPRNASTPSGLLDAGAPHTPLGIEGNGLLGIEGNGIIQRLGNGELVLNDRLYGLGPGSLRVRVDATAADVASIQPGHVVRVGARASSTGGAPVPAQLELDHLLRGPIDAGGIDVDANSIRVLGQALPLPEFAELADAGGELRIDDLAEGDYLRVSGWLDASGSVIASRLERTPPLAQTLEVSGRVISLDTLNRRMQIGDLLIDFDTAQFVYMDVSDLAVGDDLEVVGTALGVDDQLVATRIRKTPGALTAREGQEAELQGFVTQGLAGNAFVLGGQPVRVSVATQYERGTAADVQAGRFLEVEGLIAGDGVLEARVVEFDEEVLESEIRIAGTVQSVDAQAQRFSLFGLTISANVATRYEDKTGGATPFDVFADIQPGIFVELRGYDDPDGSNLVTTTRVEREFPDDASIKARVTANDGSTIALLGQALLTDSGTQFLDAGGDAVSEAQFVALAQVGILIRATGVPAPGGIDVSLLEIE